MKSLISLVTFAVFFNKIWCLPIQNIANGSPYLLNNFALNNLVPGGPSGLNPSFGPTCTANYVPNNCANAVLEPVASTNILANTVVPSEVVTNIAVTPNAIANAVPNTLANIEVTNVKFTPLLPEMMSNLQFGDVTVTGDLPIGGTIKVCGCIPVYGMITMDGVVPTAGTAVVADSCGNIPEFLRF